MSKKQSNWKLLWEISRQSRLYYLISFLSMILAIAGNYLLPQVIRFVVDDVLGGGMAPATGNFISNISQWVGGAGYIREHLWIAGAMTVAIAFFGSAFNFISRRTLALGAGGIIKRLRDRLYRHIQYLPYEWHTSVLSGDIIQRCTSDVDVVNNFATNQLMEMLRTIVLVVFAYGIMFPMNSLMAFASFAFVPIIVLYSFFFLRSVSERFLKADEAEGMLMSIAQENFTGVRVVRAFGREHYEVERFDRQNEHYTKLWMRLGDLLSSYWGIGDLITGLQMVVICMAGIWQASTGQLTVGSFIVFLSYNSMMIWPVRGLGRILSEASKTGVSLGRLQEILQAPVEQDKEKALEVDMEGDIVFEHVSFSYDGQKVLDDVSFTIKQGKTLGVLGATGSGKTTLAHLLCRLYDLKEGEGRITVGGVDIRDCKMGSIRRNVGIVLQEPFLYSRTIRDNIASLSPGYSMQEIRDAAAIARIDEAISDFTHGYETMVGERGVTLSGGQKQRVAIARTILKSPPVIIFDDSLSAVDTETDVQIRNALSQRTQDTTTMIIAHRIATISSADEIIVMERGKVAEQGTHRELMDLGGIYRRTYDMQEGLTGGEGGMVQV